MTLLLTGCQTAEQLALKSAAKAGEIEASKELPDYPDHCRTTARSGVQKGDRLDVALLRTENALNRQNGRTRRCADWYDKIKTDTSTQEE